MTLFTVMSYNLVFGRGKILHFGQLAFSLMGAYAFFVPLVRYDWPIWASLIIGIFGVILVSLLFAWLSLRLETDGLGVMSIAVHLMFLSVVLNWQGMTRGALGIPGIPRLPFMESLEGFTVTVVILCGLWMTVLWYVGKGHFGRMLSALSEGQWPAASLGISRRSVHMIAFCISGLGAFLSNLTWHSYLRLLSPVDFGFPVMIFFVMVVVAGGAGSFRGCFLSTVILVSLKEGLRFLNLAPSVIGPLQLLLFGVILFTAVWVRRETVFPKQRVV